MSRRLVMTAEQRAARADALRHMRAGGATLAALRLATGQPASTVRRLSMLPRDTIRVRT